MLAAREEKGKFPFQNIKNPKYYENISGLAEVSIIV